ncbi:sensor histidine kinase, partial [Planctomycetota bacterium]
GGAAIVEMRVVEMEWEGQTAYLATLRDITERKRRQENLIQNRTLQAQKLEAAGKLASGIVHEIRTPMQYIRDNTRFSQESCLELFSVLKNYQHLLMMVKAGAATEELVAGLEGEIDAVDMEYIRKEMPRAIQQSLEGIEGVTKIVEAMKEFSHPGVGEKVPLDINKNIENTITICRNEWKYVAEIQTDFDPDLPLVPCYPGELNQVILNLIINAAHAINDVVGEASEGKGTIIISTRQDGDWVKICVGDTGTGIPKEIQSKVFEPFITTKEVGKGTGQGLAIAHSVIVNKHGGSITFETEQDKGTVFIINLPINPTPKECEEPVKETLNIGTA